MSYFPFDDIADGSGLSLAAAGDSTSRVGVVLGGGGRQLEGEVTHWWVTVISSSQFQHVDTGTLTATFEVVGQQLEAFPVEVEALSSSFSIETILTFSAANF